MKSLFLVILVALWHVKNIHALSSIAYEKDDHLSVARSDQIQEEKLIRAKRSPLLKLPLLAGAAVLGKKALVLGGAAVGAKALVGAGLVGAGLYKAKYYSGGYGGGYGGGYASYHHSAPAYVETSWG